MVSAYSPNINLEEPARGDQVGTWDTPVNSNMNIIDLILGGQTTISLNNSPVVLSAAQFQCKQITFSSTLTGSVAITFPSTFIKSYEIYNVCTGSSAFTITLQTTLAGREIVCAPPGEIVQVVNNGADLRFVGLGRIGSYLDYAGSSVPNWVDGCTIPPYLNCDGAAFSSGLYPALSRILGGTTLPDSKGRARFTLNQGTTRITSAISGISGSSLFAAGGSESMQQHTHTMTASHTIASSFGYSAGTAQTPGGVILVSQIQAPNPGGAFTGFSPTMSGSVTVTASNTGTGTAQNMPPAYIGGITMIRAG